ncbi:MAG: Tol-Pal system beta propeller repeat protein TolB [Gammaproteobacteria bacterium]|nr:Tol-Pal system beta propeller repeat protein TolB [Gammaproteobacteria bacterium]
MKSFISGLILFFFYSLSHAVLNIEITEGVEGSLPIAVVPFQWPGGVKFGDADVSAIVTSDLARSGKFSPLASKDMIAYPQKPEDVHFPSWRMTGVDHLIIGGIKQESEDQYQVYFRLFDVLKGEQLLGYSFAATKKSLRSVAHKISDHIIKSLTGLSGAFDARVAYVSSKQKPGMAVKYLLQTADTDGFNSQNLLTSNEPIMSPVWSPDGMQLAYVSFEHGVAEIFVHDIHTAKRRLISKFKGINGAPAWSPDGTRLAVTLSKDGNPDIYILDLLNKRLTRITRHWSIDTEAVWMPDGESLIFTSSRSGKPQLYRISVEAGAKPRRLTFEGGYNANASVSRDGKTISFVQGDNNVFRVAVLYLETNLVQLVTDGPLDESPEFSPNGSMILYASQYQGRPVLAAVSTDGRHKQRLVLSDGEVREPAWSSVRK